MPRQMPAQGFYCFSDTQYPEIIYSSGSTKGNKYWRPSHRSGEKWAYLLWTCVPGRDSIQNYVFFDNMEEAFAYVGYPVDRTGF